jgi:hypothetical protein
MAGRSVPCWAERAAPFRRPVGREQRPGVDRGLPLPTPLYKAQEAEPGSDQKACPLLHRKA